MAHNPASSVDRHAGSRAARCRSPAGGRYSGSLVKFGQIGNWVPDAAFKEGGNPSIAERINSKLIAAQMVLFRPAAGARTDQQSKSG
jgi:hypothetical protein